VAASALANKMARDIWAMLTRSEDYRGPASCEEDLNRMGK
jgi:hypothetical protein